MSFKRVWRSLEIRLPCTDGHTRTARVSAAALPTTAGLSAAPRAPVKGWGDKLRTQARPRESCLVLLKCPRARWHVSAWRDGHASTLLREWSAPLSGWRRGQALSLKARAWARQQVTEGPRGQDWVTEAQGGRRPVSQYRLLCLLDSILSVWITYSKTNF